MTIGDFCSISAGTQVYTHDSVGWALSGGRIPYEYAGVSIGRRCYVGPYAVITRGVRLGACCVVAAHSLVNKSFPDNTILAGAPAEKIGTVIVNKDGIVLKYRNGRRAIKFGKPESAQDKRRSAPARAADFKRRKRHVAV